MNFFPGERPKGVETDMMRSLTVASLILPLSAILLCMHVSLATGVSDMNEAIVVSVVVSRNILHLDEAVEIIGVVKNVSSDSLMIPARPLDPITHLQMETQAGAQLPAYLTKIADWFPAKPLDGYVELKPGEAITFPFLGTLREMTFPDIAKGRGAPKLSGLFLDLTVGAIRILGTGEYYLRFLFRHSEKLSKELEKHSGGRRLWHGRRTSAPVRIEVK